MVESVLTARTLNRSVLARQLLLERSRLSITKALQRVAGLQTQYAPSGYIGLWSRLAAFRRSALTTALQRRQVVQATLMRGTIHMVSSRDFPLLAGGTQPSLLDWWIRQARSRGLEGHPYEAMTVLVRERLKDGPMKRADLIAAITEAGFPKELWEGIGLWVPMVRAPPSGTWERRRADLYGLAETWLSTAIATEPEGLRHLVRRYLGGFGPATLGDTASWAGVPVSALKPVVERMRLRRFRAESGEELLDLPGAPLPDGDTPAPVRFLGTWEALLLVHARRARILLEEYRELVFSTKNPHSVPTFLVDGSVAGAWRLREGRVVIEPYDTLTQSVRGVVEEEAARLEAFHA